MSANDRQVGGEHYKQLTGRCPRCSAQIEHWDLYALQPYLPSMIAKYSLRYAEKGGIQDLEKAQHFLEKLIEVNRQEVVAESHQTLQEADIESAATEQDDREDWIHTDLGIAAVEAAASDRLKVSPTYTVLGRALLANGKQVGWITFQD